MYGPVIDSLSFRNQGGIERCAPETGGADISLIICSRNRCRQLARCLESVGRIVFERPWELIIVDNGSTDETATVVRRFIESSNLQATYLFEPAAGKSRGLNSALRIVRGQLLAFTDDDCYPATDFLAEVWAAFDDPAIGYIGGRVLLHDPADVPITTNESAMPVTFPARSFVAAGDVQGANMAFRRAVLLEIGGFDPLFGPSALAGEDIDAVGRASSAGWKGQYRPEVIVWHHHGRKVADSRTILKNYAIGAGAYQMKVLLRSRGFLSFARRFVWRFRKGKTVFDITIRRILLWELVGMLKYTYVCSTGLFAFAQRREAE